MKQSIEIVELFLLQFATMNEALLHQLLVCRWRDEIYDRQICWWFCSKTLEVLIEYNKTLFSESDFVSS